MCIYCNFDLFDFILYINNIFIILWSIGHVYIL